MQYALMQSDTDDLWIVRIYKGAALCGKLSLDSATKDLVVAKFVELGWTERN